MAFLRYTLNYLLYIVEICIIIEALLSWVPGGIGRNTFTMVLEKITEPFLYLGRRIQYALIPNSPIDFSPIVGFFIIRILRSLIAIIL